MLSVARRAFEECTGSFRDREAVSMPVTPGPLYMFINALMITGFTYVVSFRLVNIERAAKEYDLRVPSIHARTPGSTVSRCSTPKVLRILFPILFVGMYGTVIYTSMTLDQPSSRMIFSIWVKMMCATFASIGFAVLYRLSKRPNTESFFTRFAMKKYSARLVATPRHARTKVDRIAFVALFATGIYAAVYPSALMTSLAMVGFGLGAAARPQFLARTLSVRGIVISSIAYWMLVFIGGAIAAFTPSNIEGDETAKLGYDVDSIIDKSWLAAPVQFHGVFIGTLLTAMVLRYEYKSSEPASAFSPASDDEERVPLTADTKSVDGVKPTAVTVFSPKEAFETRVTIPQDRPSFAKPLFYVLLAGTFIVHVPSFILSAMPYAAPEYYHSTLLFDSKMHPVLSVAARLFLALPGQIWTIALLPAVVGVACLVRKDGGELWRYHEVLMKPLVPAPASVSAPAPTPVEPATPEVVGEKQALL